MTKLQMLIAGGLYTISAALTPILAILAANTDISNRIIATMLISAVIAAAIAAKSFTSTVFADHEVAEGKPLKPSIKRK